MGNETQDLYNSYATYKRYETPQRGRQQMARFDAEIVGVDHDANLAEIIPESVRSSFICGDLWSIVDDPQIGRLDRNAACPWALQYQFGDPPHRTAFYRQRQGSRRRRITDSLVHRFLSWALLPPPEFQNANIYAVLGRP